MLNRWMQALFKKFHKYPIQVQVLDYRLFFDMIVVVIFLFQMVISDFFSLHDGNEDKEKNKNEILTM